MPNPRNIFLTGFMGTGKTSVGRQVARRLGWRFVNLDEEIVRSAGKSIEAIFEDEGEPGFRSLEREHLARVCEQDGQVVSTGGGVPEDPDNRETMRKSGVVVCLEARAETITARLDRDRADEDAAVRPMLRSNDPARGVLELKSRRQFAYSQADWTVHTDRLSVEQSVDEVARASALLSNRTDQAESQECDLAATVRTSSGDYPVWVGRGILDEIGERLRHLGTLGAAYVITDEGAQRHARRAQSALEASGVPAHIFIVESGEQSKNLETVQRVYQWLAERKAERGHVIVAVGGGVVGDLAGFVAATFLRGLRFAQVPTTMLAMMDSSIGGKTGVDLPQGKNLVGAFYQPMFVLADVDALRTLPRRELASGWAEAIKHGLILDEDLFNEFEAKPGLLLSLEGEASTKVIRRSAAIKADVVSRDERETLGLRVLLNYGHSIGHAIEAATGYGRFLHGEAISVGMMGAARISHGMGLMSADDVDRQRGVLTAFGLPVGWSALEAGSILEAMAMDKKTSGGALQWVLLEKIGRAVTRSDVPPDLVREVLNGLAG